MNSSEQELFLKLLVDLSAKLDISPNQKERQKAKIVNKAKKLFNSIITVAFLQESTILQIKVLPKKNDNIGFEVSYRDKNGNKYTKVHTEL